MDNPLLLITAVILSVRGVAGWTCPPHGCSICGQNVTDENHYAIFLLETWQGCRNDTNQCKDSMHGCLFKEGGSSSDLSNLFLKIITAWKRCSENCFKMLGSAGTKYLKVKEEVSQKEIQELLNILSETGIPPDDQDLLLKNLHTLSVRHCRKFAATITDYVTDTIAQFGILQEALDWDSEFSLSQADCKKAFCNGMRKAGVTRDVCDKSCETVCSDSNVTSVDIDNCKPRGLSNLSSSSLGCCYFHQQGDAYRDACSYLRDHAPALATCTDIPTVTLARLSKRKCPCEILPRTVRIRDVRCSHAALNETPPTAQEILNLDLGKAKPSSKFYLALEFLDHTTVPTKDLLRSSVLMNAIPKAKLGHLSNKDIDDKVVANVKNLPKAKVLYTMGKRIVEKPELLMDYRKWGGCHTWKSLTMEGAQRLKLDMATEMCKCDSQIDLSTFESKVDVLCSIVAKNVNSVDQLMDRIDDLCVTCVNFILRKRTLWRQEIMSTAEHKRKVCFIFGKLDNFQLDDDTRRSWARECRTEAHQVNHYGPGVKECSSFLPMFTGYLRYLPSYAHLTACAVRYCWNLCSSGTDLPAIIQRSLSAMKNLQYKSTKDIEKLRCLAFLPHLSFNENLLRDVAKRSDRSTLVIGSSQCDLKTAIVRNLIRVRASERIKRDACDSTCETLRQFLDFGVPPSEVLGQDDIRCQQSADIYACAELLGFGDDEGWDKERARELLVNIRSTLTVDGVANWEPEDLQLLGIIASQLTPAELRHISGLNNDVFRTFGSFSDWTPEQLEVLAGRYFALNGLSVATDSDIASMNHIFCGVSLSNISRISDQNIGAAVSILGQLRRCQHSVLRHLAARYRTIYGVVSQRTEADFAEFGIVIAGFEGSELRAAGANVTDSIDEVVVYHISVTDFQKLDPMQIQQLSFHAAQTAARRRFCPHLSAEQRDSGGHLERTCQLAGDGGSPSPARHLVVILLTTWLIFLF